MAGKHYDRAAEDIGNIVNMVTSMSASPTSRWRRDYYVTGLGLTRDPFLNTGARLMWINVGASQFHLPTGEPDVVRGDHRAGGARSRGAARAARRVRKFLEGTKFDFRETNDCVETVCPWGNRINVHAPDAEPLRPHRARHALCRVRRAPGHRGTDRALLSRDGRGAGRR